ncbi:MAG: class I SAM-dependent methyltransferase [Vulcanimicrobiaceae bacterium]
MPRRSRVVRKERARHSTREEIVVSREGAKQPQRFNPERAARLDDPARFAYLPVADVLALLDAPQGATLVDFGTGTGTYAIEIARVRPDLRIVALDEQSEMLELVRAKLREESLPNVEPAANDVLPSLRGRAERVLAINVLHELGDAALADVRELLHLDGTVLFVDWNADVERPIGPPRDHVYSPEQARRRLEGAGFIVRDEQRLLYHYAIVVQSGGN